MTESKNVPKSVGLIVAMDDHRLIGRDGDLPWRLPNDLRHFKALTLGKVILMGRKTWVSLGRPLPQRDNWVLTRDRGFAADGCRVFNHLDDVLAAHRQGELMVIGGAELYRQLLPLADRLYLTRVHARLQGDTWFPEFPPDDFVEVSREDFPADEKHPYPYSFLILERRQ
ncbi:MAG: dihydrofolate reductase [Stenotrophobium sp.]